jgi:hypothetical protein
MSLRRRELAVRANNGSSAYSIMRPRAIEAKLAFKSNEVTREATRFAQGELPSGLHKQRARANDARAQSFGS